MRPRVRWLIGLAALVTGCTESTSGNGDGTTTELVLAGGGFTDTGVFGFGGLDLPDLWTHMFGRAQEADFDRECRDQHRCGVGGVVDAFGLLTGEDGRFAVVTTGDFRCTTQDFEDCADQEVPVIVSGVQTFPQLVDTDDGQVWTEAELVFRYSLLSSLADPAGAVDSVVVRAGPDGSTPTTVLRLTAGDLADSLPVQASTCGTQPLPALGGAETTYLTCSEWQDARLDITEFIGQEISFQFVGGEAGAAIALAFDNVKIGLSR
jgi:hypothetical protein